jgi:uncharacterized alpha-E superfamily protein
MLSRTADHLFWMAHYMERAESAAQAALRRSQNKAARNCVLRGSRQKGGE